MVEQIQLDPFQILHCVSQWHGLFSGFAVAAVVLLTANNMVELWRIFLSFLCYPEGGLRPGVAELWSRSTPTGMRIVSDLRAAPLASSLPLKAANCRGHKEGDCRLSAAATGCRKLMQPVSLRTEVRVKLWNKSKRIKKEYINRSRLT